MAHAELLVRVIWIITHKKKHYREMFHNIINWYIIVMFNRIIIL